MNLTCCHLPIKEGEGDCYWKPQLIKIQSTGDHAVPVPMDTSQGQHPHLRLSRRAWKTVRARRIRNLLRDCFLEMSEKLNLPTQDLNKNDTNRHNRESSRGLNFRQKKTTNNLGMLTVEQREFPLERWPFRTVLLNTKWSALKPDI